MYLAVVLCCLPRDLSVQYHILRKRIQLLPSISEREQVLLNRSRNARTQVLTWLFPAEQWHLKIGYHTSTTKRHQICKEQIPGFKNFYFKKFWLLHNAKG